MLLLFGLFFPLAAQQKNGFPYYISWEPVTGAGGFVIEVETPEGDPIYSGNLPSNAKDTVLTLPPRAYRFRLVTLNKFMREENKTDWIDFVIEEYTAPIVNSVVRKSISKNSKTTISMSAVNLSNRVTVVLVSPSEKRITLTLRKTGNSSYTITTPILEESGEYTLILTNPPDLITRVRNIVTVLEPVAPQATPTPPQATPTPPQATPTPPQATPTPPQATPTPPQATPTPPQATQTTLEPTEQKEQNITTTRSWLSVGGGPSLSIMYGSWNKIYSPAFVSGNSSLEFYFSKLVRPKKGSKIFFSTALQSMFFKLENLDEEILVKSSVESISLSLSPSISWSMKWGRIKYFAGAGLNHLYVRSATPGSDELTVNKTSYDQLVLTGLVVEFTPFDFISIGMDGRFTYINNPDRISLWSASVLMNFYIPIHW